VRSQGPFRVAVVGATGLVGAEIVSLLAERSFPVGELFLYASERSAGEEVEFVAERIVARRIEQPMPAVDVAFLCATSEISRDLGQSLADDGAWVIDLAPATPEAAALAVSAAEVRRSSGEAPGGIAHVPDPLARMIALPVRALARHALPRRVIATLLVSASAFGRESVGRLSEETVALFNLQEGDEKQTPVATFRCIPELVGRREGLAERVEAHVRLMLGPCADVVASVIRVPIFFGQAASISVELEPALSLERVREVLRDTPSVLIPEPGEEPTSTLDALGADGIYVIGLRQRGSAPAWLHFWALGDNVRQGAALAAVSLAEELLFGSRA
jgi:aspartate-semialdehyde dehydrogenase